MKKILVVLALATGMATTAVTHAKAQVHVSVNIGVQPQWGPSGYDYAGYYYLPDINAYYDVNARQFVYQNGGNWIYGAALPYQYRNFDLYNCYKVVINEPRPWLRNGYYYNRYAQYRGYRSQPYIGYRGGAPAYGARPYYNPPHYNQPRVHPNYGYGYNNNGHYREGYHGGNNYGHNGGGRGGWNHR